MKIVDVDVEIFDVGTRPALPWRDGLPSRPSGPEGGYLRVTTDDGVTGRCVVAHPRFVADLVDRALRAELVGRDPFDREYLWKRIWEVDRVEYLPVVMIGIVDVALWDLAGKALNVPVYQLLGGFRNQLPAYASTVTFETVAEYLDVADQIVALGFRAMKLHAWGDARRDARLAEAVRERVGDDLDLMYDGSAAFDLPDAVYLGAALSDVGFRWYEEPMKESGITPYKLLAERVSVPLLVAEVSAGANMNTADFIASGCATYVRTSTGFKGGLTGALKIAHLAESFGLRAEVHGPGLPNEHLCMAIPNTTYYESLVTSAHVTQDPRLDRRQMLPAPTAPGVGWPVDR
jgi:L-alanine-DL-glutamate epimerase-like enolase superfamily enzyme